ncbi:helix-turn-helix domain-containing protein [Neobacillus vireti]|uniref:Helix-turn-helix domain-containing protein n=1 Tax=Neobacillus vireti LMG 21834 TaxID=1131730 RepID=A0AB94IQK7_9BACI|nr:helix-turn-helix domain-containing protein [Neobacillus vireti]ETI69297.1 helix-turn-helix domain-containing protein [Neobacillus vireti LMG 21834]KLT19865.1 DNA-binding protein [Neobacillus vireti]
MADQHKTSKLGLLLKELLKEKSLSMRKLSELTTIDTATISRIINGKRRAKPEHLQKIADCLGVPITDLFVAAGYPVDQSQEQQGSDIHWSIDSIQNILDSSEWNNKPFSVESVEQQLAKYQHYAETDEGKETILTGFKKKLRKVGSIGPFISQLKEMFERFRLKKGSPIELAIIGSVLIYFIISVDVIPDYIFPIGYLDDAVAVKLGLDLLSKNV